MNTTKLPTAKTVAAELVAAWWTASETEETDVRLCVWEDGRWELRTGLVDYDTDHAPFCGATTFPPKNEGEIDAAALAADLLDQVDEQIQEGTS